VLILQRHGITKAAALRGGLHAWEKLGYPTTTGTR